MSAEQTITFPAQFRHLERFADWSLATETERNRKRHASTMAEIRAFRDAIMAGIDSLITYLNRVDLADLPPSDLPLLYLLLSLAEIAPAVEFYDQQAVVDGYDTTRFPADEDFVLRPSV
jgi:hypothetical protein